MNRRIVFFILIIFITSIITLSCTSKSDGGAVSEVSDNKSTENTTIEKNSSNEEVNQNTNYSNKRRIVFHETVVDSQAEYLNTLGGVEVSGLASIDITLYESEFGIFEGFGTITRTMEIPDGELNLKQEYIYRTGLIHIESGKENIIDPICSFTEIRDEFIYIDEDVPYNYKNQKDGTMQQDLPVMLKIEGEEAILSVKFHEQATLAFKGKLINIPEQAHKEVAEPEGIIYINCMWSDSFMGGNGDYNAILLASSDGNKSYSGKISINGSGNALNVINEEVTFSIERFYDELYVKSGGKLEDKFEYMGVFSAAGYDFILLFDGQQVILEIVGKEKYFCGGICPANDYNMLENEADKTSEMVSFLYRIKDSETENYVDYAPPSWYPHELIPKVNFSEYDGFMTIPVINEQFFKLYITEYYENENLEDLIFYYSSALSKQDRYKEFINYENGEAVFLFTMGKYNIQVFMQQSSLNLTSVGVQIY